MKKLWYDLMLTSFCAIIVVFATLLLTGCSTAPESRRVTTCDGQTAFVSIVRSPVPALSCASEWSKAGALPGSDLLMLALFPAGCAIPLSANSEGPRYLVIVPWLDPLDAVLTHELRHAAGERHGLLPIFTRGC